MAKIHPGATLTPYFRDFLPPWLARQPWYLGTGTPALVPVGHFRFEDPAGQVGIETHLVSDGGMVYQVPMTYRGAPLPGPGSAAALITTAEHSVLGTRWPRHGGRHRLPGGDTQPFVPQQQPPRAPAMIAEFSQS